MSAKCVCAAHPLCPSEGDHEKLGRKSSWYGMNQQSKERAGAGMGRRDEVVLNTQCLQTKCLIPSSNKCTAPAFIHYIATYLTYILRAIYNPE